MRWCAGHPVAAVHATQWTRVPIGIACDGFEAQIVLFGTSGDHRGHSCSCFSRFICPIRSILWVRECTTHRLAKETKTKTFAGAYIIITTIIIIYFKTLWMKVKRKSASTAIWPAGRKRPVALSHADLLMTYPRAKYDGGCCCRAARSVNFSIVWTCRPQQRVLYSKTVVWYGWILLVSIVQHFINFAKLI